MVGNIVGAVINYHKQPMSSCCFLGKPDFHSSSHENNGECGLADEAA